MLCHVHIGSDLRLLRTCSRSLSKHDPGSHHAGIPADVNQSSTKLPSGLGVEKSQGTWNWKRLAVSDDGMAIVAITTQEGAPSLWLWTDHAAGLPQHFGNHTKVSVFRHSLCKAASSWLLPCSPAVISAGVEMHACMVGCLTAPGLLPSALTPSCMSPCM